LGVAVNLLLEQVEDYEGDTGSSFEVMRRISRAVSDAIASKSFPLVLSGNCIASAAVACGLQIQNLALIYFDAHDYLDSPDVKWVCLCCAAKAGRL
jgi:arginase